MNRPNVAVKFPETGRLGEADIVACGEGFGEAVGVAVAAGAPTAAAKTVKELVSFFVPPVSSFQERVRVCAPTLKFSGGVQVQPPLFPIVRVAEYEDVDSRRIVTIVPGVPVPVN